MKAGANCSTDRGLVVAVDARIDEEAEFVGWWNAVAAPYRVRLFPGITDDLTGHA